MRDSDAELVEKYTRVGAPQDDKPRRPAHRQEKGEDNPPYAEAGETSGAAVMLDVRLRTGDRETFPYAYLVRMRLDASGIITLKFSDTKVEIRGRNLGGLYDALKSHAAAWIQEGDDLHDETPEEAPFISAIKIADAI